MVIIFCIPASGSISFHAGTGYIRGYLCLYYRGKSCVSSPGGVTGARISPDRRLSPFALPNPCMERAGFIGDSTGGAHCPSVIDPRRSAVLSFEALEPKSSPVRYEDERWLMIGQ